MDMIRHVLKRLRQEGEVECLAAVARTPGGGVVSSELGNSGGIG